jgi:TPR repeat protein
MSAEEVFKRFASRILFLTCEESADESALASGVLVSADGFIVTNAHVVEDCRKMTATYISGSSRRLYEPVLKYYDKDTDTAVLKIPGEDMDFFPVLERTARIGERVFAIGNPMGLEQSISEGIVSGNREEDGVPWIQHSAPISPGSSGGALISSHGEMLGINSFLLKNSQNLNFAVPTATLSRCLSEAQALAGVLRHPPGADAQFRLGLAYVKGEGVPRDYTEAATWFRAAAAQGHLEAEATLGGAYELGRGVKRDYAEAAAWYRKAAQQGYPLAQELLGYLYEAGKGVPRDYAEAETWFEKAADQGDANAQYRLAVLYEGGEHGLPHDYPQAAAWYRKAAEQGLASAQFCLGVLYESGEVPRDYGEAYFWIKVAAAGKMPDTKPEDIKSMLGVIATHLTAADLSQAQERAREWLAAHGAKTQ